MLLYTEGLEKGSLLDRDRLLLNHMGVEQDFAAAIFVLCNRLAAYLAWLKCNPRGVRRTSKPRK